MITILTLDCTMLLVHRALFLLLKVSLPPEIFPTDYWSLRANYCYHYMSLCACALPTLPASGVNLDHLLHKWYCTASAYSGLCVSWSEMHLWHSYLIIFSPETLLQAMQIIFITAVTVWPSCCSSIYRYSSVHCPEIDFTSSHALSIPITDSYRLYVVLQQVPLGPLKG